MCENPGDINGKSQSTITRENNVRLLGDSMRSENEANYKILTLLLIVKLFIHNKLKLWTITTPNDN